MKFQIRTIDLMIEQETIHHIRFLYSIAELGRLAILEKLA